MNSHSGEETIPVCCVTHREVSPLRTGEAVAALHEVWLRLRRNVWWGPEGQSHRKTILRTPKPVSCLACRDLCSSVEKLIVDHRCLKILVGKLLLWPEGVVPPGVGRDSSPREADPQLRLTGDPLNTEQKHQHQQGLLDCRLRKNSFIPYLFFS